MVAVVNSWSRTATSPSGFFIPPPAGQSLIVPVANTGNTGNWLIAICGWQTPVTFGSTVAVGDDGHNRWEPLGAPGGTTSASGVTRCSIWAAPTPGLATNVFVAPNAYCQALGCLVVEMSGLPPWLDVSGTVTAYANAATALGALALTAPLAPTLVLTAAASDLNTATVSLAAGGWTALTAVAGTNGADHTADIAITSAYQVTSGATTASFTSSAPLDLSGVCVAVLVNPPAPMVPSQTWPLTQFQAGFGSGVQTPWDQITWTDLTGRFRGMTTQHGKQYELDSIQAGTNNFTLSNNDGALTPGNSASPYYPGVTVYTPVRLLVTWPPPPAANAKTYVVTRGFMERWPQVLSGGRYQSSAAVATDVWATLTPLLRTVARAEILLDQPFAYWPLSDVAGSASAANLAPANQNPLTVVQSKYGAGAGTYSFGNTPSNLLAGDPSTTVWAQTGLTSGQVLDGYSLVYTDSGLPPISGGVTVEGWFQVALAASQPASTNGWSLIAIKNGAIPMCRVWLDQTTGNIKVTVWDKLTHASTTTIVNTNDWANQTFFHVALLLTQTTWQVIVDGGAFTGASGTCNLGTTWAFADFCGEADRLYSGNMFNGQVYGLAIFPRLLPNSRIVSHYYLGTSGLIFSSANGFGELAGARIERILADSSCLQPRTIGATVDYVQAALDIQGQAAGQNVVNMAESESGLLYVDGPGYLRYLPRRAGYNLPSLWTAGERAGSPLNTDPSFAGTLGPWTATGGTATLTQAQVYGSPYSALLTPSGVAANSYLEDAPAAVTAGGSYIASAFVWSPTGYASVTIGFDWYQAGGGFLSTSTATIAVAAGTWTPVTTTQTAPANAVTGAIRVGEASTPAVANLLYVSGYGATMMDAFQSEAPYQADITFDYDPSQVYNDITVTQYSAPQAIGGADVSTVVAITSPQSISTYGDQTLQETVYLANATAVGDLANRILNLSSVPLIRVAQMTFDPSANPALWPIVLSAEVGQVVNINRRLGGTLLEISGTFQILNVAHQVVPRQWTTRISAVTYPGTVLTADDPVRGQLSGANVLGF